MLTKTFELRDRMTFIPVFAIYTGECTSLTSADRYLLRRCGYDPDPNHPAIILGRLDGSGKVASDPYEWDDRTFQTAHLKLLEGLFHSLESGAVLDVEYLLGETPAPKRSERFTSGA